MSASHLSTKSNSVYSCFQLIEQSRVVINSECQSSEQLEIINKLYNEFNDKIVGFWEEYIDPSSNSARMARSESSTISADTDPVSKLNSLIANGEETLKINEDKDVVCSRPSTRRTRQYFYSQEVYVLVVDDCLATSKILAKQLKKFHYKPVQCNSGAEALAMLLREPEKFDLVLCDLSMPGLDGYEVLKTILASPVLQDLPVVMVSCADDAERAQKLVQAGAKDYFEKPTSDVVIAQLIEKIKRWRDQSSSIRAAQLHTFYNISQVLVLQVKIVLGKREKETHDKIENGGESTPGISAENSLEIGKPQYLNQFRIVAVNGIAASPPMQELLGVTNMALDSGTFDVFPYIHQLDMPALQDYIMQELVNPRRPGEQEKLLWRWVHSSGEVIPVTGRWASLWDGNMIIESTSLLPTLRLKHEQKRRVEAEEKLRNLEQDKLHAERMRDQEIRTNNLAKKEMETIVWDMSNFSRMVTENSSVLSWRLKIDSGEIDFVSDEACFNILGFYSHEMDKKTSFDFVFKEDLDLHKDTIKDVNRSSRIRRIHRDGSIRWLESRTYAWWNKEKTVIIVTEYDITDFLK